MYRVFVNNVFTKLTTCKTQSSKFNREAVRLYCNHIKPESVSSANDTTSSAKREDAPTKQTSLSASSDDVYKWLEKLVYSSYLERFVPQGGYKQRLKDRFGMKEMVKEEVVGKTSLLPPLSVRYMLENQEEEKSGRKGERPDVKQGKESEEGAATEEETSSPIRFPYQFLRKTEFIEETDRVEENQEEDIATPEIESVAERLRKRDIDIRRALELDEDDAWSETDAPTEVHSAGTEDPSVPASNVPCGGCGALLHCQDKSIPGYISSEKFKGAKKKELMSEICYRCGLLDSYQTTLNVNVSAEDYPRIVGKIKETYSMVLLLVDLTDFPCSIWPGILDIIGHRRPVFLVGNKVDMITQDSPDYLKRLEESLIKCAVEAGMIEANILHTALISAKTGYGVEELITSIFNLWRAKGDVFIMGCTNVGKSSLFNIFLKSDLCQPEASDLVQKATISQWPGTTLNLLKFPLTPSSGWRKSLRQRRLIKESPVLQAELRERHMEFEATGNPELATLTGYVGKTFITQEKLDEAEESLTVGDIFRVNPHSRQPPKSKKPGQWDPWDFANNHWVYDTPGAVNNNQILDLLTLPELRLTLPKTLIIPRTFFIKPETSFFIGGLFRIDFLEGDAPIRYTLFSNADLPVTMTFLEDADDVYKEGVGTKVFGAPVGSKERMEQFPELVGKHINLRGTGHNNSVIDLVLSSVGWVAVTGGHQKKFRLRVYSPGGKGLFFRQPAVLPYAVNWKGKRIRGTYSYLPHKIYHPQKKYKTKRPPRPDLNLLRNEKEN